MAKSCSFDVVSEVDLQEVDNAVNQANKELATRYDFKNSKSTIELEGGEIKLVSDDDHKIKSVIDVLQSKIIKRGIELKSLEYGKVEPASGGLVRQNITVKEGISKEKGKELVAAIKKQKLKVQAQIMDDKLRVTGKNKDDLQEVIQFLKANDFDVPLQFNNFRS
ncbi:hypothetical protein GGQ84_001759 [Desulfitispora alkaliphila]|uniref:YajQ family cyclic di-GMP-binding protein n=1 Tax=Desulfitispora alkaliphila TaxID=622674 RepID=UPI003D255B2F